MRLRLSSPLTTFIATKHIVIPTILICIPISEVHKKEDVADRDEISLSIQPLSRPDTSLFKPSSVLFQFLSHKKKPIAEEVVKEGDKQIDRRKRKKVSYSTQDWV